MLQLIIGFIGAFTCAPLALIFPAIIHTFVVGPTSLLIRGINVFLVVFGFGIFCLSTNVAVQNIIAKVVDGEGDTAP